jgi:excisionase family DNA binding protein
MSQLLTATDVAERCGITPQAIRRLCREGRVPHLRVGGVWRFDPDDIAAWLESRRVRPDEVVQS